MSAPHPTSSLLRGLVDLYDRLDADREVDVAPLGFSREKIHFVLVLEPDGRLFAVNDVRERTAKGKPTYRQLLVPDAGGRSGTGLRPFFCWDNTGYVLGRDNKGNAERAGRMFEAFRDLHRSMRESVGDDAGYDALCAFLEAWEPESAEKVIESWEEVAGQNVVFQLRATEGFIHQSTAVRKAWQAWQTRLAEASGGAGTDRGLSLLSGEEDTLARLHPQIGGVAGANTTGAAIVSFNLNAFESYGKSQSFNAPVGIADADKYTKALNRLLGDPGRRVRIGDATVVFWSGASPAAAPRQEMTFQNAVQEEAPPRNEDAPAESFPTIQQVGSRLRLVKEGGEPPADDWEPSAPFYILGLSPNASRLHVRFWLPSTFGDLARRLAEHHARLEIVGTDPDRPPPMIRSLLLETAREAKNIPPQLAGQLARSVLLGERYPETLLASVVRRVRQGDGVNTRKAAILKAILIRNHNREVPVALQPNHLDPAYQLGRLFATLEYAQRAALGDINKTIKDGYFGAASSTPASVFPRLLRLHQHHVEKLPTDPQQAQRDRTRTKRFFEVLVQEICAGVDHFPRHLALEKQGLFQIAYYHQRQDFFKKRTPAATNETNEEGDTDA